MSVGEGKMSTSKSGDLTTRLDAVIAEARGKVKAFQTEAEAARQGVRERFEKFLPIAERIVAITREKLEKLRERLKFEVIPSQVQTERFYSRSVTLDMKSELAGVFKVGFQLGHDSPVRLILLDYTLEIVPIFFRFNPHARLQVPLEAYDEAAVGKWLDDCLVEFANAYVELLSTKQYQERVMVTDPVAGISFPKYFAAATLEHEGKTYQFVSDETRREFAKAHGLAP
jgi:YHS domain-containing protein